MYLNAHGCRVYYEEAGSGKPILLLHGWNASSQAFKPIFYRLAKNRKVRAIDFPGFGQSELPPLSPQVAWDTQDYAQLVKEALDSFGDGPTDIVAHSFGARVAIRLAAQHPNAVKRLILTGAAGIRIKKNVPPLKTALAKLAKAVSFVPIIGGAVKEAIYRKIGSPDYLAAGDMRPILVRVVNEDLEPLLKDIKNEALLIWGNEDAETPLEAGRKMNAGISNSRLEIIEGAGHYAFADRPEEFYGLLDDFLEKSPRRNA